MSMLQNVTHHSIGWPQLNHILELQMHLHMDTKGASKIHLSYV